MFYKISKSNLETVSPLLKKNNLKVEKEADYTVAIFDQDSVIGTGSTYRNIIKMVAVDNKYAGENLTATIISHLVTYLNNKGFSKHFLFTTPNNKKVFSNFGFGLVSETNDVALLENSIYTINDTLNNIKKDITLKEGTTAAIVMNCNPITNGHLFLIEKASKENDNCIIFLVEEDLSFFPFKIRKKLVEEAVSSLSNVFVVPSTEYIISSSTFPSYFLKEMQDTSKIQMELDAQIFKQHFLEAFSIDKRYVGTEPTDILTSNYNNILKNILGDKLVVINRLTHDEQSISASLVRKLYLERNFSALEPLVPPTTLFYLMCNYKMEMIK